MRRLVPILTCSIALLAISGSAGASRPALTTEEVERPVGDSGCTVLPDKRIACSGEFMRAIATGYQDQKADAVVCRVRLGECRGELAAATAPVPTQAPPLEPLPAFGVGAASGVVLAAGVAVLLAGGPVEVGATMSGAGAAGLLAGVAILAW